MRSRKARSPPGRISATPPGFASLPARRAIVRLVATPIVTGMRVRSRTAARAATATSQAAPWRRAEPVTSTKKSSIEATCTLGESSHKTRTIASRLAFAARESPGRKIARGHSRAASDERIPGRTPAARAS